MNPYLPELLFALSSFLQAFLSHSDFILLAFFFAHGQRFSQSGVPEKFETVFVKLDLPNPWLRQVD